MPIITDSDQTLYKGFGPNMTCFNGFTYSLGQTMFQPGVINIGQNGLHCCRHLVQVFSYYPMVPKSIYAVVTIPKGSTISESPSVVVSNYLRVDRILSLNEIQQMSTGVLIDDIYWSPHPRQPHHSHPQSDKLYIDHIYTLFLDGTMLLENRPTYSDGTSQYRVERYWGTNSPYHGMYGQDNRTLEVEPISIPKRAKLSNFQRALINCDRSIKSYNYATPNMLATLLMISFPNRMRAHSHVFLQDTQQHTHFRCRFCYTRIQIVPVVPENPEVPEDHKIPEKDSNTPLPEDLKDLTWERIDPFNTYLEEMEFMYRGHSKQGSPSMIIRKVGGDLSEQVLNPDETIFYRRLGADLSRSEDLKMTEFGPIYPYRSGGIHPLDSTSLWALQLSRLVKRTDIYTKLLCKEIWSDLQNEYPSLPDKWEAMLDPTEELRDQSLENDQLPVSEVHDMAFYGNPQTINDIPVIQAYDCDFRNCILQMHRAITELELWSLVTTPKELSNGKAIDAIWDHPDVDACGHSGGTFSLCMRYMRRIASNGWDEFVRQQSQPENPSGATASQSDFENPSGARASQSDFENPSGATASQSDFENPSGATASQSDSLPKTLQNINDDIPYDDQTLLLYRCPINELDIDASQ